MKQKALGHALGVASVFFSLLYWLLVFAADYVPIPDIPVEFFLLLWVLALIMVFFAGRLASRRWHWAALLAIASWALMVLLVG